MKTWICLLCLVLIGCGEIKPMTIAPYEPPNLTNIQRPAIPVPKEGVDYFIDTEKNTVTYSISGQDLLGQKIISEEAAWAALASCKQIVDIQTQIIQQERQLIITLDLQRQITERKLVYADIQKYAAAVVAAIFIALIIFAK